MEVVCVYILESYKVLETSVSLYPSRHYKYQSREDVLWLFFSYMAKCGNVDMNKKGILLPFVHF